MASLERRLLQAAVALGSLVPIGAGALGVIAGPGPLGLPDIAVAPIDLDSHVRYLSGVLLAIGLGYASTVPAIETHGRRFRLLTAIVVVGGLARLVGVLAVGVPGPGSIAALVMELVVTPALALWQHRIARAATPK